VYGQARSLADRSRILSAKGKAGEKKKKRIKDLETGSLVVCLQMLVFGVLSSCPGGKPVHFDRVCRCIALLCCSMLQPYALK